MKLHTGKPLNYSRIGGKISNYYFWVLCASRIFDIIEQMFVDGAGAKRVFRPKKAGGQWEIMGRYGEIRQRV